MKKILSFILVFSVLLSLFSFSAFAAYTTNLNVLDMTSKLIAVDSNAKETDITSSLSITSDYFNGLDCVRFDIPAKSSSYSNRFVHTYDFTDINSTHEYNLKFDFYSSVVTSEPIFMILLTFYNTNGVAVKSQILYTQTSISLGWNSVNFNFVPDISGLTSGFTSELSFLFQSSSILPIVYRLSNPILLTDNDKDDNTGFFESIINAIKELPSKFVNGLKSFFDNLGNKLTEVKDSISTFFNSLFSKISELSDNISSFFTSLGDRISSFFTNLGDRIKVFFTDLGNTLIDGLKYLFIPSDNYFSNKFTELQTYFEDKFGLFALPFTLIIRVLNLYNNIGNEFTGEIGVIPIDFFGVKIFDFSYVNLKDLILGFDNALHDKFGFNIYQFYLGFVDCLILLGFSKLVKKKYNSMFDTGSFDEIQSIYNDRRANK